MCAHSTHESTPFTHTFAISKGLFEIGSSFSILLFFFGCSSESDSLSLLADKSLVCTDDTSEELTDETDSLPLIASAADI